MISLAGGIQARFLQALLGTRALVCLSADNHEHSKDGVWAARRDLAVLPHNFDVVESSCYSVCSYVLFLAISWPKYAGFKCQGVPGKHHAFYNGMRCGMCVSADALTVNFPVLLWPQYVGGAIVP